MNRESRFLSGKKQDKIRVVNFQPSVQSMREGEEALFFNKNGSLSRYRKEKGLLWRSDMSHNGSQSFDNNVAVGNKTTTGTLEYKNKFIDYRVFIHNFAKDLDTNETFLPWASITDNTATRCDVGYLTPFKMTCFKLLFKVPVFEDNADDIVFKVKKIDDGDTTVDEVCNFTVSDTTTDNTIITINESDWNNAPTVEPNDVALISIDAADAGITTSSKEFFVSSLWRVEVEI